VDAIDQKDDDNILEEAGDILMQAVFHAVLKEETGAFTLTDVVTGVCQKLITRHTHVFGEDKASDDLGALSVWEANKRKEKGQDTFSKSVNDVPKCFPAVMRAQKVGKRAGKAGMDFKSVKDASERLQEELNELFQAIENGKASEIEKEVGDLLFSAVNVGRKAGADCEKALKESVDRFALRFTKAEELALKEHEEVDKLSESEWDNYYKQAKASLEE
jgi:tetrapyrrole methylase family protein/MazG family protein